MNLFEKVSMFYNNLKESKKSIQTSIDVFIIVVLLLLIITPLIVNLPARIDAASNQVVIYLSPNSEDLFGKSVIESLIQEFEERYPGIRIRIEKSSGDMNLHDILIFDNTYFSTFVAEGMLIELNSFTNYDTDAPQMAIPLVSFMDMLFYNIDILSAAGFGAPPKTRDEFLVYARRVSRGEFDAYGAAISLSSQDRLALSRDVFTWIWANGNGFFPNDRDRPFLNTRAIVSDLNFLGTLHREGLFAPGIFETTGEQRIEQFAQGKIALMVASSRVISNLRQKMGDDAFGITTIPDSETGLRYSINLSSIYAGINTNTNHPDEVWKFLEFLTEKSFILCDDLKAVPGMFSNIIPGDYVRNDPFYSKAWDIFESALTAESFTGKPGAELYKSIFLEEFQVFFESNRSAQETVTAIQRRWDEITNP
jgi:multiple sugar transport system substrate-binding protein